MAPWVDVAEMEDLNRNLELPFGERDFQPLCPHGFYMGRPLINQNDVVPGVRKVRPTQLPMAPVLRTAILLFILF